MKRAILILTATFFLSQSTFAQTSTMNGFRKNFATVMFCGLGGAILGLSTLSFYGNPQDHIGNISTGFVIGLLAGTGFVATSSFQKANATEGYSLLDNDALRQKSRNPTARWTLLAMEF